MGRGPWPLAGRIAPVHGAVNRPLVKALGDARTAPRALRRDVRRVPPRAAAMQLCLLRETLATVNTEAETALALQGLGSSPIVQSGNAATKQRWLPGSRTATSSPGSR